MGIWWVDVILEEDENTQPLGHATRVANASGKEDAIRQAKAIRTALGATAIGTGAALPVHLAFPLSHPRKKGQK